MSDGEKAMETTPQEEKSDQTVLFDCSPNKDGGVLKEIITPGVGEDAPLAGDKVKVHYVGSLTDGTKFDSSRDRDEFFEFTIGKGEVIKAWDLGVATMKRGEKAILTCRPEYAYGEAGAGESIPSNSTLLFEVELFDWKGEDISPKKHPATIMRRILAQGEGFKTPAEGNTVDVHLVGSYEGRVFEDREVQFTVGEASEENVIEGIDHGIRKFKKGEKSRLQIKSSLAYGSTGNEEFNIPADTDLTYEVELKNLEKTLKEAWEMNNEEKIEQSDLVKTKGTNYFKAGKYQLAVKQYKRITDYLEQSVKDMDNVQKDKANALLVAAYLNMAMCHLKEENYHETAANCDKALELDENNVKGLFRRGQARFAMKDYDGAEKDYTKAIQFDPENKAVKKQLVLTRQKLKEFKEFEKKKYFGMFSKFAEMDSKEKGKNMPYHVKSDEKDKQADVMENVEEWENKMADGMMSLEQEAEAFGEEVKPKTEVHNGETTNGDVTEDGEVIDH